MRATSLNRVAEPRDAGGISTAGRSVPAKSFVEALDDAGNSGDVTEAADGGSRQSSGHRASAPPNDRSAVLAPEVGAPGENANLVPQRSPTAPNTPAGEPIAIQAVAPPPPGVGAIQPFLLPQSPAQIDPTEEASTGGGRPQGSDAPDASQNGTLKALASGPVGRSPGRYAPPPVTLDGKPHGSCDPVSRHFDDSILDFEQPTTEQPGQAIPLFDANPPEKRTTASGASSAAADRSSRRNALNDSAAPDPALAVLGANLPSPILDAGTASLSPPAVRSQDSAGQPVEEAGLGRETEPLPVGARVGRSNSVPAQSVGADTAREVGGAQEAPAAMPATQTLDASRPRSSHPTVLDKSRDIPNAEQSPAILGSSPPIGTIVIDPQILRSGMSGEDADTAPTAPIQFAVMPSPVVEKAVPGGAAADNSSGAPAPDAAPAALSEQLFRHVMGSIENGAREVVLRLHPSGLGDLTIRLAVSGREVSAWFATPQTQVQQAISEAIGQLHSTLGNAGYTLAGAWIGNDASNQRAPREQLSAPSPARQAVANAPLELPSTTPISSSSTGVSVYA